MRKREKLSLLEMLSSLKIENVIKAKIYYYLKKTLNLVGKRATKNSGRSRTEPEYLQDYEYVAFYNYR